MLHSLPHRPIAWDIKSADIQVQHESPVQAGRILCASCYCGDDVDFGDGPHLFIDNSGLAHGLLEHAFKGYFQDPLYKKVFHNYSFDRHLLRRHSIGLRGVFADTMTMARVWNTSLAGWEVHRHNSEPK